MTLPLPSQPSRGPGARASADARIRVMIVDDSVVVRGMLARWLEEDTGFAVVATHRGGRTAVEQVQAQKPDVIVLDIDMPDMDGLTALPLLLKALPSVSIVIASTLTTRNAETTLKCLALGAHDYVAKPATNRDLTFGLEFRRELIDKIKALGQRKLKLEEPARALPAVDVLAKSAVQVLRASVAAKTKILLIGASTGGPAAVAQFLKECRPTLGRFPTVICQHMPSLFTRSFAESLRRQLSIDACEAQHGEPLEAGRVYVAPGGRHFKFQPTDGDVRVQLTDDAPVHFCRPSVDVTFQAAAPIYSRNALGVILTGMGTDGLAGSRTLTNAGANVIAQDQASSVIWGMPGAVARDGLCSLVAPVERLAKYVETAARGMIP